MNVVYYKAVYIVSVGFKTVFQWCVFFTHVYVRMLNTYQ